MKPKEKYYIVYYTGGDYDTYYERNIFITNNKSLAQRYVKKFNNMLKKWLNYYNQFTEKKYGVLWLKEEHHDKYFRWDALRSIDKCYFQEINFRKK
jgi:hypothetical protein